MFMLAVENYSQVPRLGDSLRMTKNAIQDAAIGWVHAPSELPWQRVCPYNRRIRALIQRETQCQDLIL